jgi:hypothetical protein
MILSASELIKPGVGSGNTVLLIPEEVALQPLAFVTTTSTTWPLVKDEVE